MAGKKLQLKDFLGKGSSLNTDRQKKVKGGYKSMPSGAGSVGMIDWTSIDIRNGKDEGGDTSLVFLINGGRKP